MFTILENLSRRIYRYKHEYKGVNENGTLEGIIVALATRGAFGEGVEVYDVISSFGVKAVLNLHFSNNIVAKFNRQI